MSPSSPRRTRAPKSHHAPLRRCALGANAVVLATSCGGPPSQPPETGHAHDMHPAHGPLVHRFEHADQWAPQLDDPGRDAWQRPKDILDAMEIQPGMTVADIGAGTGYFEPWLSRAAGGTGTVLALDVEPDMVRYLSERMARERLTNVKPALVPFDDPKLPSGSVDRVVIVDTWHHISDREAYAAKLRNGLRVGGRVCVVDFKLDAKRGPPPHHRLSAEQVARELTAGGLSARVATTSLPEHYIVIGARP